MNGCGVASVMTNPLSCLQLDTCSVLLQGLDLAFLLLDKVVGLGEVAEEKLLLPRRKLAVFTYITNAN